MIGVHYFLMKSAVFFIFIAIVAIASQSVTHSELVSFSNNKVALAGTLYLPDEKSPHPAVVVYHAASGGMRDYPAYQHLIMELPTSGFAVLLFDRRGSGKSGGDFNTATFQDLAKDGIAGISYLKTRKDIDSDRIGVWGVSQGGWLGPLAATLSSDVSFVVSVSGPGVTPARQMDFSVATALRAAGQPETVVNHALKVRVVVNEYYRGRLPRKDAVKALENIQNNPWFSQAFLSNSENLPTEPKETKWYREMDYDPIPTLRQVRVPIAFFFAENDAWVPIEESIANIRNATQLNSIVQILRIPGTDHLMGTGKPDSGGPTSKQYVNQLLKWLSENVRQ
jgi:pimeloyl-ACP methyl ester carboxylesterase